MFPTPTLGGAIGKKAAPHTFQTSDSQGQSVGREETLKLEQGSGTQPRMEGKSLGLPREPQGVPPGVHEREPRVSGRAGHSSVPFHSQSAPDFRRKLQRLELGPSTPTSWLMGPPLLPLQHRGVSPGFRDHTCSGERASEPSVCTLHAAGPLAGASPDIREEAKWTACPGHPHWSRTRKKRRTGGARGLLGEPWNLPPRSLG